MVTTHGIHLAPEKRRIGWVPQDAALFPHLTVAENVAFGMLAGRGSSRAARRAAKSDEVRRLLDLVDLGPLAHRAPGQLSGGQAQRVALARALAAGPELVLLDEPFGALDPMLRADLRASVRELLRTEGVTGILVTHDQAEALSIADHVAVLRGGEVLQLGTPEEVYQVPATPWVAGFVGDAVFLPGVLHGDEVATSIGRLRAVPVTDAAGLAPADGEDVTVLIRPEELRVAPAADPGSPTEPAADGSAGAAASAALDGIVTDVEYTGHDAMLAASLGDGMRLRARVTASGLVPRGTEVRLSVAGAVLAYRPETA
jgi:iron(III) transport system ATP-binding protein